MEFDDVSSFMKNLDFIVVILGALDYSSVSAYLFDICFA